MKVTLLKFSAILAVAAMCSSASASPIGPPSSGPNDPPLTHEQLVAALIQQYRKDEQKKLQNDLLYLESRKASKADVRKYFGDTSTDAAKPSGRAPSPEGAAPPPVASPCGFNPHLFIRRDRLDTFQLREDAVPLSNAKGASVSFTEDQLSNSNSLTINGRIQYLMIGYDGLTPCNNGKTADPYTKVDPFAPHFGYAIAPWVDAQGTINYPSKNGETNNLQTGVDAQISIFGGAFFDHQYFILTPYYQTDFRGIADVQGVRAAWEPVVSDLRLGGYVGVPDPYIDWYWQLRGEFDEKHVSIVGSTGLARGDYHWFGGTAQAHVHLFPGRSTIDPFWQGPVPLLTDRLYANASISSYWNSNNGRSVSMFEAELGYNLTTDGKSSISAKYDKGTDKDTLLALQKYLVALNFKY